MCVFFILRHCDYFPPTILFLHTKKKHDCVIMKQKKNKKQKQKDTKIKKIKIKIKNQTVLQLYFVQFLRRLDILGLPCKQPIDHYIEGSIDIHNELIVVFQHVCHRH